MSFTKDFKKFNARKYLSEQYRTVVPEDVFILRFLHETYLGLNRKNLRILEIGGGPTIYQLLSASAWAKEITFTDFLSENLEQVQAWVKKSPDSFGWTEYVNIVAHLEGEKQQIIEKRLRTVLKTFLIFDILGKDKPTLTKFDIVSSHFCADSITNTKSEFLHAVRTITSFVAPNGMLVMSMLKGAVTYDVGNYSFPAYFIDEQTVKTILKRLGFKNIEMQTIEIERNGENNANICLWARRK